MPTRSAAARLFTAALLGAVALAPRAGAVTPVRAAAPVPAPSSTISAFGVGELKAEWLTGYNGAEGLDTQGVGDLGLMGANGMGLYRARFRQDSVMGSGGTANWTQLDNLVRQAALKGVSILPVLINMPGDVYTPPTTDATRKSFGDFAAAAADRYGPAGTFWASCGCPARQIRTWEVWNEPNLKTFWPAPAPAAYAATLTATRARLRTSDPTARILFGGLATPAVPSADKLDPAAFLRGVVAVAGPNSFDALSVHNYYSATAWPAPDYGAEKALRPVVDALKASAGVDAAGAPRQQVWVTEFGRTTPASVSGSEAAQADYYSGFLNALLAHRADWNLGPALPYAFRDAAASSVSRWGLRRTNADDTDAGAKAAWSVVTARTTGAAALPLPQLR